MTNLLMEWLVAILVVTGGFFVFVAGLGVLRLQDTFIRMHASTKAGTLGVGLILLAVIFFFADLTVTTRALLAIVFIVITSPVAAHMLGRSAYKTGTPLWHKSVVDEWRDGRTKAKKKLSK